MSRRWKLERSWRHGGHYPDCVPDVVCHCPLTTEPRHWTGPKLTRAGRYYQDRDPGDEDGR